MSDRKEWKALVRQCEELGWSVHPTRHGSQIRCPFSCGCNVTIHNTPSDHRALKNATARVRSCTGGKAT
jgi:hypothetical protein